MLYNVTVRINIFIYIYIQVNYTYIHIPDVIDCAPGIGGGIGGAIYIIL